jgi:hypothetical protein
MAKVWKKTVYNVSITRLWNNFTVSHTHDFLSLGKHQVRRISIKRNGNPFLDLSNWRWAGLRNGFNREMLNFCWVFWSSKFLVNLRFKQASDISTRMMAIIMHISTQVLMSTAYLSGDVFCAELGLLPLFVICWSLVRNEGVLCSVQVRFWLMWLSIACVFGHPETICIVSLLDRVVVVMPIFKRLRGSYSLRLQVCS